jgi:hypothetical protein
MTFTDVQTQIYCSVDSAHTPSPCLDPSFVPGKEGANKNDIPVRNNEICRG